MSLTYGESVGKTPIQYLKSKTNFKSYYTAILAVFFLGLSALSYGQSTMEKESAQLVKFCESVNELSKVYCTAVSEQLELVTGVYNSVITKQPVTTYPQEQVTLNSHYGQEAKNITRLERVYTMDGAGIESQGIVVAKIKDCQRGMRKVDMLNKSFADYVNSKNYHTDPDFSKIGVMYHVINQSLADLKNDLVGIQLEVAEMENKSVKVLLEKHKFKRVLAPMNDDLLFIVQIFKDTETGADKAVVVNSIQEKRLGLAASEEKRKKEVAYVLKNAENSETHKDFYNRYHSALTKNENQLKKNDNLTEKELKELQALNNIVLNQLRDSFDKLKGTGNFSQAK